MQVPAMVLAAGRGERMRPLTDHTPKPLLSVAGKPLLQWHLDALARSGVPHCVINTAWLGAAIEARFPSPYRSGSGPSLDLRYSREGQDFGHALETAGGLARALPLLGELFWVVAGDVFVPQWEFDAAAVRRFAASDQLAHLWLVPNPAHHPRGDFGWTGQAQSPQDPGLALDLDDADPRPRYTYSTMGLYRRALFESPWWTAPAGNPQGLAAPLGPLLRQAMRQQRVSAELYPGPWSDIGTAERLHAAHAAIAAAPSTL